MLQQLNNIGHDAQAGIQLTIFIAEEQRHSTAKGRGIARIESMIPHLLFLTDAGWFSCYRTSAGKALTI